MEIIVWGINYAPELTGIGPYNTGMCEFFAEQGHEVRAVTTFPYYPEWKKRPADRKKWFASETINGVTVDRGWHYVPAQVSSFRRILHEASFVVFSFFRLLLLPAPDVYVVVSPPLLLGFACGVLKYLKRTPFVFHVQDLQPGAAIELGMIEGSLLVSVLLWLESFAYHHAAVVSGISPGMLDVFGEKGVEKDRTVLFPNWVKDNPAEPPAAGQFRAAQQIPAQDLLLVYSGNLGYKQGLEILITVAELLQEDGDRDVTMVICGAGARREILAGQIAQAGLRNLRLVDLLPEQEYESLLRDADACVITQISGTGRTFFPSKLLAALQRGKPVLAVSDLSSELARAIADGGFGVNVLPDDVAALAEAIRRLRDRPEDLEAMGPKAFSYARRFDRHLVLSEFTDQLGRLVRPGDPAWALGSPADREPNA